MMISYKLKSLLKDNVLLWVYLFIFGFLALGVFYYSGTKYLHYLGIYLAAFLLTYWALRKAAAKRENTLLARLEGFVPGERVLNRLGDSLLAFVVIFVIAYYIKIGSIPVIKALQSHNSIEIAHIRGSVGELSGPFFNYICSFVLKALMPFLLLYFYARGQKVRFFIILFFSCFFAISLLHKSYIFTVLLPLIIYPLLQKRVWVSAGFVTIVLASAVFLVIVANPSLRGGDTMEPGKKIVAQGNSVSLSMKGLAIRVFLAPGQVVSLWFDHIPNDVPFLEGCGYRFLAPVKDCEFTNYDLVLYDMEYPEMAAQGLHGSLNAASFMYEYANFGVAGLILSGVVMGLLVLIVQMLFAGEFKYNISLNIFNVFILNSTSITTLLLSGGWGLMILLFLVFRRSLRPRQAIKIV